MIANNKLSQRFSELENQLKDLMATRHYRDGTYSPGNYVDDENFTNWTLKARHLIEIACGDESAHFRDFTQRERTSWSTNHSILLQLRAVFNAAREDFDGGYLTSVRNLVQAEVFSNELDQARELLRGGYMSAAAVIAGVVLETALRQLCDDAGIATGPLSKMNIELTKAGIYTLLIQKRITALADIRNSAAHGHPDNFTARDVEDMIVKVESFIVDNLA